MSFLFASTPEPPEVQLAGIDPARTPTNQAGRPLPVFWGKRRMGITFISGPWRPETEEIREKQTMGKREYTRTTGHVVRGSFAAAMCMGRVDRLNTIYWDGRKVFRGNPAVEFASRGASTGYTALDEFTVDDKKPGKLRFYWGTRNQPADDWMTEHMPDQQNPEYSNIVYIVAEKFIWGVNKFAPPAFEFELSRYTRSIDRFLNPGSYEAGEPEAPVTFNSASGDFDNCALVEVIHDLLTNRIYGAAIPRELVNTQSFVDIHNTMSTNFNGAVYISPIFTGSRTARQALAELCQYGNLVLRMKNGKISLGLVAYRSAAATPPAIPDLWTPDFVAEPSIQRAGWGSTWNQTRVTFSDRELDYGEDATSASELGHEAYFGAGVQREFQRPFVTKFNEAQRQARQIQAQGAVPQMQITMRLKSHRFSGGLWKPMTDLVAAGDIVLVKAPADQSDSALGYQKLGIVNAALLVRRMRVGGPANPGVTLDCEVFEETLTVEVEGSSLDPSVPDDPIAIDQPTVRLGYLTREQLKGGEGEGRRRDGLLIVVTRKDPHVLYWDAALSWKDRNNIPWGRPTPDPFPTIIHSGTGFAKEVAIHQWKFRKGTDGDPETVILDCTFAQDFDFDWFWKNRGSDMLFVCQTWRVRKSNNSSLQHSVTPTWMNFFGDLTYLISPRRVVMELLMDDEPTDPDNKSVFGSPELRYATDDRAGRFPTVQGFIGWPGDFGIVRNDQYRFRRNKRTRKGANFERTITVTNFGIDDGEASAATSLLRRNDNYPFAHGVGYLTNQWGPEGVYVSPRAGSYYGGDPIGNDMEIPA